MDSLYFHLVMLIIAGLLLAFSLGFTFGAWIRSHGTVKCGMEAQEKRLECASPSGLRGAEQYKDRRIGMFKVQAESIAFVAKRQRKTSQPGVIRKDQA